MDRERLKRMGAGIPDKRPVLFEDLRALRDAILAKPDYYDDGTPGEYDRGVNPAEGGDVDDDLIITPLCMWTERDEDDGAMFSTSCGERVEPAPGLQTYCHCCGRKVKAAMADPVVDRFKDMPADQLDDELKRVQQQIAHLEEATAKMDPVDHTRTTNPDGTRTPTDEKLVPIGEGPITSPFTSDRNPDGTRTPKGSGHVTLDELDAEIEPAGPVVNENTTTLETAGYGPEAIKSIERGLSQTDTVSRGSFAQYAVPTPDEVTEALRWVDDPCAKVVAKHHKHVASLAAAVRELSREVMEENGGIGREIARAVQATHE